METPTPQQLPDELPVVPLRRSVLFPLTVQPLAVDRPVSVESINRALGSDRMVFLTLQQTEADDPQPRDLLPIGTVGIIRQMAKAPGGAASTCSSKASRARAATSRARTASLSARLTPLPEEEEQSIEVDAYVRTLRELIDRALNLASGLSQELRADRHEHRRPAAPRVPARQPARHEGRGQAEAPRGEPARW